MVKVFIAEDHRIVREGLRSFFDDDPEFELKGEAENGKLALAAIENMQVDVAVVDINMPEMNGIELTRHISANHPDTKVLILTMLDSESYVKQLFEAGATGYILKTASKDELLSAIKTVASGECYISHKLSYNMLNAPKAISFVATDGRKRQVEFSRREMEMLELIAEGYTNEEIADKTFTSKRTVETHRKNMIEKTGTRNSVALIRFAVSSGIIK